MKKTTHSYPYTLHGQIPAEETNKKYLRVTIADNMTWNTHIEQIVAKRNKKLDFLRRHLKINNPEIKSSAYKTPSCSIKVEIPFTKLMFMLFLP